MNMYSRIALLFIILLATGIVYASDKNSVDFHAITQQLISQGDQAVATYDTANAMDIEDQFSTLYFDIFEASGMEMAISLRDPKRKSELESLFSSVIGTAARGKPEADLHQAWNDLREQLKISEKEFSQPPDDSFWSLVLQAFLILLREGFEAMLVITALLTYLKRQGANEQLPVIYYGVGLAIVASIITAWLLQYVFHISGGTTQEALEGITMLTASAVLFYVSYWLISKSESARWQTWIQGQIHSALSSGSVFALGLAAFLAVYREGAETVLFYQALAGQTEGQVLALTIGVGSAAATLVGMFWLMRRASQRLSIGLFFAVTAGLLYYLAVSFAGNGVLELQSANWVSITPLSWMPRITWLGVHPTLETTLAQILPIIPLPFAVLWWMKQRNQQTVAEDLS